MNNVLRSKTTAVVHDHLRDAIRKIPVSVGADHTDTDLRTGPTGVEFVVAPTVESCQTVLTEATFSRSLAMHPSSPQLSTSPTVSRSSIMSVDGVEHVKLKRVAMQTLSRRNAERWRRSTIERTRAALDELVGRRHVDLVSDYTYALPMLNLADLLGIPEDGLAEVMDYTDILFNVDALPILEVEERIGSLIEFTLALLGEKRGESRPGLIADLRTSTTLRRKEAVDMILSFLTAGYHTVSGQMAIVMWAMTTYQGIAELIRDPRTARDAVCAIADAIPVTTVSFPRMSSEPSVVAGAAVAAWVPTVAGLREAAFDNVASGGASTGHGVAFGFGRHRCPGDQFAIDQLVTAATMFQQEFPSATLLDADEVKWTAGYTTSSVTSLPVDLTPKSSTLAIHH